MTNLDPNETARTAAPEREEGGRFALVPDRDPASGRFAPGNKAAVGAGGNSGWLRQVREAFQGVVTPADAAEVWRKILAQAKDGEPHAQALVVRYTGAPPEPEHERQDVGEAMRLQYQLLVDTMVAPLEAELERLRVALPEPEPEPEPERPCQEFMPARTGGGVSQ